MRIGLDLGGTKIEGILLSDDGTIAQSIRVDTPAGNYLDTVEALCGIVNELQAKSKRRLLVGIGTPGALTNPEEVLKNCNSICLNGQPLKKDIEQILGYEIRIENDANCFTLSEALYGSAREADSVFGVILGTGTGGGIVINKQLLTGPNAIAGEWGHNSLPSASRELIEADRTCYCGRRNCIETVLSGRGMTQTYHEHYDEDLNATQIAQRAAAGDQNAKDCIELYCRQLASCLATVVNVLDPDMIVLGGGLSNIDQLYRLVPIFMQEFVFTEEMQTRLSAPSFGDASGARGAACLWPLE